MNKKTFSIVAISFVIAGLLTTTTAISITDIKSDSDFGFNIVELNLERQVLQSDSSAKVLEAHRVSKTLGDPEFYYPGDQLHPGFGTALTGQYMAAYRDEEQGQVIWTYANDDGVYYDLGGDYPSIKLWDDGTRFFGTLVPDYDFLDGAAICIFDTTDPTNFDTYNLRYWDWSDNGWSDILDMDIGCDNSQEPWEWGFVSLVASTTYGDGVDDGPFISYQTAEDGYATISWYYGLDGCEHADASIDRSNQETYAVYDWLNPEIDTYELIIRKDYFNNWDRDASLSEIQMEGNIQYPAISAAEDNIVIVAQYNEGGNDQIICIHGRSTQLLQETLVTTGDGNARYPDIRHVQNDTYICSYIQDNTLYITMTEDAGATWSTPSVIEDDVEEEYKATDLSDYAFEIMYEVDNGEDIDIYRASAGGGSNAPVIEIKELNGGFGITAVITNTGSSDGEDIEYSIAATGGLLGFINKQTQGTIDVPMGSDVTIKLPMLFGLGKVTVNVNAGSASQTASATQILIYTLL